MCQTNFYVKLHHGQIEPETVIWLGIAASTMCCVTMSIKSSGLVYA